MSEAAAQRVGVIARSWWLRLNPDGHGRGGNRGALARLRRAETPHAALLQAEAMALFHQLNANSAFSDRLDQSTRSLAFGDPPSETLLAIGVVAATLAHVKPPTNDGPGKQSGASPTFAEALGRTSENTRPEGEERARYSASRFAGLVRADDWETRMRHFRRALRALKGASFDVAHFADDVLFWGPAAEARWIFAYHQNLRAVPERAKEAAQ